MPPTASLGAIIAEVESIVTEIDYVEISDQVARSAGELAQTYGLRGYDTLHLAPAALASDDELMSTLPQNGPGGRRQVLRSATMGQAGCSWAAGLRWRVGSNMSVEELNRVRCQTILFWQQRAWH